MSDREVKVRLSVDASDYQRSLSKADEATQSFASSAISLFKGILATAAGAALGSFFRSAAEEAAKSEEALAALENVVRNSGTSFRKFQPEVDSVVDRMTRLTKYTDEDLYGALTRMIGVTGQSGASLNNLGAVADLATFKHVDLEVAATAVGKAMNGNTAQLNKLGISGDSANVVLSNLRANLGGAAEKEGATFGGTLARITNNWGEFQEAVGKAILANSDAREVMNGVVGVLIDLGKWVKDNELEIGAWAQSFLELGRQVWDIGATIVEVFGPVVAPIFKAFMGGVQTVTFGFALLTRVVQDFAGKSAYNLGWFLEKGAKLLNFFGVQVSTETARALKVWGDTMVFEADRGIVQARETFKNGWEDIWGIQKDRAKRMGKTEEENQNTQTGHVDRGGKDRKKLLEAAMIEREIIVKRANKVLDEANKTINYGMAETEGRWNAIDKAAGKAKDTITLTVKEQKNLTDQTHSTSQAVQTAADLEEQRKQRIRNTVSEATSLAGAMVNAGQAAGVISDNMAKALNSVIGMANSIGQFATGDTIGGIISLISGLANLLTGWGTSAQERARQEAVAKNTDALVQLTADLGDYNGSASGSTFSGVLDTLQAESDYRGGGRYLDSDRIKASLAKAGISYAQAKKIADTYGIDVEKDQEGWAKLLDVMKSRKYGSASGNFGDELASLQDSFDVLGTKDADDRLGQFRAFLKERIPILGDALAGDLTSKEGLDAAATKLKDIYRQSIGGKLTPADYKKATPAQFRQIIATLLPLLGDADGVPIVGLPNVAVPATPTTPGGASIPTPGTGGTASYGLAFPIPSLGMPSLSIPTLSTAALVPNLVIPKSWGAGRSWDEPSNGSTEIGSVVQGDLVVQVTLPNVSNTREAAEQIAEQVSTILGRKLALQTMALGQRSPTLF